MPLDPAFVEDCPYGPGGLLIDEILSIDAEKGEVICQMPVHAPRHGVEPGRWCARRRAGRPARGATRTTRDDRLLELPFASSRRSMTPEASKVGRGRQGG
jgi:hypothetical protein